MKNRVLVVAKSEYEFDGSKGGSVYLLVGNNQEPVKISCRFGEPSYKTLEEVSSPGIYECESSMGSNKGRAVLNFVNFKKIKDWNVEEVLEVKKL